MYLPEDKGRHPAVVWILGGQQTDRLTHGDLVSAFTNRAVGYFSYDKRGGGQSQGKCCPGDYGHFNLLTADAVGAINALRSSTASTPAGSGRSAPARRAGSSPRRPWTPTRLQSTDPSGSDPKPYLEQLRISALWPYGTADREVPVDQSVALLNTLKTHGKDFTVVTFPDAGHGLLDSPPTTPRHRSRSSS